MLCAKYFENCPFLGLPTRLLPNVRFISMRLRWSQICQAIYCRILQFRRWYTFCHHFVTFCLAYVCKKWVAYSSLLDQPNGVCERRPFGITYSTVRMQETLQVNLCNFSHPDFPEKFTGDSCVCRQIHYTTAITTSKINTKNPIWVRFIFLNKLRSWSLLYPGTNL